MERFYDWFNRVFSRATDGYVSICQLPHPQVARSRFLFLVGFVLLTGVLGNRIPGSFLPEEDQGYLFA